MADVERGGRLVEQHDRRLLRERPRDDDTLLLAARERPEPPVGERQEIEPRERAGRPPRGRARPPSRAGRGAACGRAGRTRRPSSTAESTAPAGRRRRAGRARARASSVTGRRRRARSPRRTGRAARPRAAASSSRRRSGRSARPTRPSRRRASTRSTTGRPPSSTVTPSQLDRVTRRLASSAGRARRTARRRTPSRRRSGSPPAQSAVRATTSASTRNPAPTTTDSGISARYPTPVSSRIACGTMIPTKPMSPVTATAAAVPSVAATTSASRTRRTFTPRLAASSSPRLSTSTTRRSARITTIATATYGRIRTTSGPARARDVPEDPRVDLLQRVGVLLLDERLPRGEERRHRHAGEDERRRVALAARGAADRVGEHDGDGAADERRDRAASAGREGRPGGRRSRSSRRARRRRRRRAGTGSASGLRKTPWYVAPASGEHRADERREHDARHPDLPEDRLLGRGERRRERRGRGGGRRRTRAPRRRRGRPARRARRRRATARRNATAEHAQTGVSPRARTSGGVLRDGRSSRYWRSRASADDIARKKSTSRGPQREAIESSTRTIEPVRTALTRSQPGRAATVDAFCPQQTVSASTMRSGLAETTYSAESCG